MNYILYSTMNLNNNQVISGNFITKYPIYGKNFAK